MWWLQAGSGLLAVSPVWILSVVGVQLSVVELIRSPVEVCRRSLASCRSLVIRLLTVKSYGRSTVGASRESQRCWTVAGNLPTCHSHCGFHKRLLSASSRHFTCRFSFSSGEDQRDAKSREVRCQKDEAKGRCQRNLKSKTPKLKAKSLVRSAGKRTIRKFLLKAFVKANVFI